MYFVSAKLKRVPQRSSTGCVTLSPILSVPMNTNSTFLLSGTVICTSFQLCVSLLGTDWPAAGAAHHRIAPTNSAAIFMNLPLSGQRVVRQHAERSESDGHAISRLVAVGVSVRF